MKENLQNPFPQSIHSSDDRWQSCLAAGRGAKRRFQYCIDDSGISVYFRALQGHSGRNLIDPSLQDNFFDSDQLLPAYLPYWMCVQSSFYHQLWMNTWRSKFEQETDSILLVFVDLMDKGHQDPEVIVLNVPRHAQYLHNAWKKHQDAVYWVDIILAIKKGLTFYRTRSNATIFQVTFPAYCIPKVVRPKTGEVLYEKSIHVNSISAKRSHWNTNGRENRSQYMLNDPKSGSYQEVPNRTNHARWKRNVPFSGDRC